MKKIILISGKAESGKDTFAGFLKDELEKLDKKVLIVHYADYIKYICKIYYGWNGKKDESGRTLLQSIGNKIRKTNPNFWVNRLIQEIASFAAQHEYVIIPDVRFKNEIYCMSLTKYKIFTLRINRLNNICSLTPKQRADIGETGLDNHKFDYIYEAKTITELQIFATQFVEELN